MKSTPHLRSLLVACGTLTAVQSLHAANLFWDGGTANIPTDGNGASGGTSGDWDTTLLNWDAGAAPHVAWNNATNDTAFFAGTVGTVTLKAPVTVGGMTFGTNAYVVTGTAPNQLTLAAGAVITNTLTTNNNSITISAPVTVTDAITKAGPGGVLITGDLTIPGTSYNFANIATTAYNNALIFTVRSPLSGAGNSVVISGSSPIYLTSTTAPTYGGTTTVGPGAALGFDTTSIAGIGGGTGVRSISMGANSVLMFRGGNLNNTVLGQVVATSNVFTIIANNAGCANALDFTLFPNASLATWDQAGTATFTITGTITPGSNGYRFGSTKVGNNMNLTIANTLTGNREVTVNGGNLRLAAAMDYTGNTTINAGTFTIGSPIAAFPTNGNGQIGGGDYAGTILNNGTLAHTSSLDQTLSGVISGTGAVVKTFTTSTGGNAGTWGTNSTLTLAGVNTYTGLSSALAGTLSFNSITDVGGAASALGAPITVAAGTIAIGSTTNGGALRYTGGGHTTDRVINLAGTTGGATLNASGSGALVLTSNLTATGAGIKTLTLTGTSTADNTLGGIIIDNSVANTTSLVKSGGGTWVLSANNANTGGTTVAGGILKLDYAAGDTSRLADAGPLTLAGGTLDLAGGSHVEVVDSTTLTAGTASQVTRGSGTSTLAMNTVTPGAGAVVNFAAGGIATTDNPNTNGILGTWATVGGIDWAANSTGLADGSVVAYTGYTDINARGSTLANGAASNVRILGDGAGGPIALDAGTTTINTLLQSNGTIDATLDSAGKTLRTGAIWIGSGKAALTVGSAAGDGLLTAPTAGGNLALINDNTAKNLTVNAVITDNSSASTLSTAGPGTVVLNGTNTHTGGTTLGGGTLVLGSAGALGSGIFTIAGGALASTGTVVVPNDIDANADFSLTGTGTLTLSGGILLNANRVITNHNTTATTTFFDVGGSTRTLTLAGDGNTTVTGIISTGTGGLVKNGGGTLTLTDSSTYTGTTVINGGTLQIGNGGNTGSIAGNSPITNNAALVFNLNDDPNPDHFASNVISGTGSLTKLGSGTLILTGNSTYTGATVISAGTLQIGNNTATGALANTSGITNDGNLAFSRSNALTVGSLIGGAGNLTQGGSGTLTLTNTNTYTGDTILAAGTLSAGDTANLGAPAADLVFRGGALQITGTTLTSFSGIGHPVTFTAGSAVALDINSALNTFTVDQVLNQDTGGFIKRGAGTAILNQVNTYSGDTTVSAGTLLVNSPGSLAPGELYVDAGTLGGNGTLAGNVTVYGPANLAPGAGAGTLTIGGGLDVSAQGAGAGKLVFELDALAATSDKIAVTGSLTIGTDTLGFNNFTFTNLGGLEVGTYKLITSGGVIGSLDPANLGGTVGAFKGTLQINVNTRDLELVLIPGSPFETWIAGFNVGGLTGPNDDPDFDGVPNLLEFALNSSPASGGSLGKTFTKLATVGGTPGVLTYTLATRNGAVFAASGNNQQAVVAADSLTYLIEAANDLTDWGGPLVEEVTGADAIAIQSGLPAPDAGWTYHTFRTDGDATSDARDFIRAEVTSP
jgi:autotransporter-associated beta strand protein